MKRLPRRNSTLTVLHLLRPIPLMSLHHLIAHPHHRGRTATRTLTTIDKEHSHPLHPNSNILRLIQSHHHTLIQTRLYLPGDMSMDPKQITLDHHHHPFYLRLQEEIAGQARQMKREEREGKSAEQSDMGRRKMKSREL